MKKEKIVFAISLIGFALFYCWSHNTFDPVQKELFRIIWVFCLILCIKLLQIIRKEDREESEDQKDSGEEGDPPLSS